MTGHIAVHRMMANDQLRFPTTMDGAHPGQDEQRPQQW